MVNVVTVAAKTIQTRTNPRSSLISILAIKRQPQLAFFIPKQSKQIQKSQSSRLAFLFRAVDYLASILAQVSRKPTVRLNTNASGFESLASAQK